MNIKNNLYNLKILLPLFFLIVLTVFFVLNIIQFSLFLVLLTFSIIFVFFFIKRKIDLFDPLNLFVLYYILVAISNISLINNGIYSSQYLCETSFYKSPKFLLNLTCFYYLIGLIFIIIGYIIIPTAKAKSIKFNYSISKSILNIVIVLFLFVGILNFSYNIFKYAHGNVFYYLTTMSLRTIEFSDSAGTTIGYNFYSIAIYLILYYKFKYKIKLFDFQLILIIVIGFFMKLSTGRITGSLFFILSILAIVYYYDRFNLNKYLNKNYYYFFFITLGLGIVFYFFRLVGNLYYNEYFSNNNIFEILPILIEQSDSFIIGSGNIPNTPLMMKIIDSWDRDHGYLYGESFITWIFNGLPRYIRPLDYQPSAIIKNLWFPHVPGGNLPPTIVGEMYMNFGFIGPIFGMFFMGVIFKLIRNYVIGKADFFIYVIYVSVIIPFALILPKGEMDNLSIIYIFISLMPMIIIKGLSCFNIRKNV